jgi:hypothetical protein
MKLWLFGGCHCARIGTDGEIKTAKIVKLIGKKKKAFDCASALVNVGLWDEIDGGYRFHDWGDWNELKDDKQKRMKRERDKKRAQREKKKLGIVPQGQKGDDPGESGNSPGIGTGIGNSKEEIKDLGNSPDEETEQFTDPSQDREWMQVVKLYSEIVGFPNEPYALQRESESILRLAKQMDDKSYLQIVQRALKSWCADDWVQQKRLPLSNLVKNFGKFAGANAKKPTRQGLDSFDMVRLENIPKLLDKIQDAMARAEQNGDQVAYARHEKRLKEVIQEQETLRSMR